jgi:hypothetical protein
MADHFDGGDGGGSNVYLMPSMMKEYRSRIRRLLETERFREAHALLRFLLDCRGQDGEAYAEWHRLLRWLEAVFPELAARSGEPAGSAGAEPEGGWTTGSPEEELPDDEEAMRGRALSPRDDGDRKERTRRVIGELKRGSTPERRLLALEKAVYLDDPEADREILEWLLGEPMHPSMQFRALQTLRRRGVTGRVLLNRAGETVELEIERTPLKPEDFPPAAGEVLERACRATESYDPMLPQFAREMWDEILRSIYGTSDYEWMASGEEEAVDCWAAALHLAVQTAAYGTADEAEIRAAYGVPESLRFRFEQACRAVRRAVGFAFAGPGKS